MSNEVNAQHLINVYAAQRNAALDQAAIVAAQLAGAQETIRALMAEVAELKRDNREKTDGTATK